MKTFALIENEVCVNAVMADDASDLPAGTWVDITGVDNVGIGWGYVASAWVEPTPEIQETRFVLTGIEWVETFTDAEWNWIKNQRKLDTAPGHKMDKLMDAIRWTNSVDVSASSIDGFYTHLLASGIPGGQTRIDELRAGVS